MNFYKRHIGDYIKKAGHLTLLEHGIYARLMDVYYTREAGIPADKAARLIGARSKDEQQALANVLDEFFTLVDGLWTQNRCEEEIEAANAQADANRTNGKKGGRPKRKETDPKPTGNPLGFDPVSENNLSQTPDTRLQTPDLTHRASTQPELGAGEGQEPTPVGALSIAMRGFGIMSNPGDPRLMAIAAQGVTPETVKAACEQAKRSKPNEPIGPAYVFAILERWAKEASDLNAAGATRPAAPGTPPAPIPIRKPQGMDPKGTDESYEEYQARIDAAELARRKGNGA
ncbi:YdaU family protein [Massilia sp. Leaf139]|uniref:YdaU family protein n=1 Tax=Massilia sp. Leaf139 TaxID=1736272 RepID=UPI0006F820E2|nr:YdaU family protein [Massilia sp. Leaf139]KQQ94979.1 hypothetical protein ASF77_22280 [Massilia sp. Leaf139]